MSFFFAISNMAEKVLSMKVGGAYWFTDLTTPDDLFILPVLTSLTFLATVELNMQDGMEGNPMAKTMKTFSRVFGLLFIPSTLIFPKAIFFYWVTANLFSLVYGAEDGRNGTFMIGNESFPASLLDLPAVVESYKTYDDSVLIKTADIGQGKIWKRSNGSWSSETSDHQEIFNPDHQVSLDNSEPAVATGNCQDVQEMDCDPNLAPEKGESDAACTYRAEPSRKPEVMAGVLRIVPSYADVDADYWLASDLDVNITDAWGT